MPHINIEIKARCKDYGRIRTLLQERRADFKGTDHQVDTYFKSNYGRLKLREGNIENNLIFYNRPDQKGPKQSDVRLMHTSHGPELKDILRDAIGVLLEVDKSREIYYIDNVKFHLDSVKDLGTFVEIEAIDTGGIPRKRLLEQCSGYMKLFGIQESDLLEASYSDMLLAELEKGQNRRESVKLV